MAKLVVLNEGLTGQSYELKADKTTIGRVEDNTFHDRGGVGFQPSLRDFVAGQ